MLVLASRSPRREALLRATGIEFRVVAPPVEELTPKRIRGSYSALVKRSALEKAQSVGVVLAMRWLSEIAERGPVQTAAHVGPPSDTDVVLGADTIVVCGPEVLGKPRDVGDARRMLRKLSGKWHRVYTGVALVRGSQHVVGYERTEVAFRRLSKVEVEWYVGTGEPMDKAGGYAIQGEGAGLIRTVRGCYTKVIGLPMPKLLQMLRKFTAER